MDQKSHIHRAHLLMKVVLPLLGYKRQPVRTTLLEFRHANGTRVLIGQNTMYYKEPGGGLI